MCHDVTHSLVYKIQRPIRQHHHKTKQRKYSDNFTSHGTATLHIHKVVQNFSLQKVEQTHNGKIT